MTLRSLLAVAALVFSLTASAASAQQQYADNARDRVVTALQVTEKIHIDGELSEESWNKAPPANDFTQTEPLTGKPASEKTEVRVLYDRENLYVGVFCFDSEPEKLIVADLKRNFRIQNTDFFGVILDTLNDDRSGYMFGTNPAGAKTDAQVANDGDNLNQNWDGIWYVKARRTAQGWQAEYAIPFKTLRFSKSVEQTWGVNFYRRIRRKNEEASWAPLPRYFSIRKVSLAGTLRGLHDIGHGRNLYVKPYISAPIQKLEKDDWDFQPDAGLDVKYGLGEMTLDLTVNTDFSQVEVDEQQVNLTRFSLFFPEKREFFLENAGVFQFGGERSGGEWGEWGDSRDLIPFFSRRIGLSGGRIVPLLGGARLTGRVGPYSVGALSIQADQFGSVPETNFSVARVQRDIFKSSDLGALFIDKRPMKNGRFNRTFGTDANFRLSNYLSINSYLLNTETPGVRSGTGAGHFKASWRDQFWEFTGAYLEIGQNFNDEVGFVPRKGMRKSTGKFGISPRPKRNKWVREFRPYVEETYITDRHNILETRDVETGVSVAFEGWGGMLNLRRNGSFERLAAPFAIRPNNLIPAGDYRFSTPALWYASDRSRPIAVNALLSRGSFYNGRRNSYTLGINVRANHHFSGEIQWSRNDVKLTSGSFRTNLVTGRVAYSFSTEVFLNALLQYNSDQREWSSNVRLNIIHRPLSDFFLVYNERRDRSGSALDRAVVAKLTYLFQF